MPKIYPFDIGDIINNKHTGRGIVINRLPDTDTSDGQYRAYFYNSRTYMYLHADRFVLSQKATSETIAEAQLLQQQAIGYFGGKSRYDFGDMVMDPLENMALVLILDNGRRNMKTNRVSYHIYIPSKQQFDYREYKKKINNLAIPSNPETQQQARQLLRDNEFIPSFL